MEPIWKKHWPASVDEKSIRLPDEVLPAILARQAKRVPDRAAIQFYGRAVTFAELDSAVGRFAGFLQARGLQAGDRVAIFLENSPQFAIAYYGALRAGGIAVCLNPMHKAVELLHEFEDSGVRALVTSDQSYEVVEPIRAQTRLEVVVITSYRDFLPENPTLPPPPSFLETRDGRPEGTDALLDVLRTAPELKTQVPRALSDTALLQYTSGTTGTAKAAEITHANLVSNCEMQHVYTGSGDSDVALGVLPWFHITGMECQMNMMAYVGATVVAIGRFDLVTVLRAVELYRCTLTTFIATVNVAVVNFPRTKEFDLSSLRRCFSGGAPVPPAIAQRWEAITGHKLIEGYGLSETTAPTHINPPHRPKYGTVGVPIPLTEARIVDQNDSAKELGIGQSGEIAVRGPQVMKGYWRNPDATRRAFRDGWFLTGDIGHIDEEGYFTIEERKKDMLKVSGYSVFPAEVEAIMYRHPAIAEVGVVGVPDPYRGEDPVAFVVLKPGQNVSAEEIVEWCRKEMAVYKAPRHVWFIEALPRTASGKVLKRLLRDRAKEK
ncbi:MAG TPA: long-chain fatty acid--CoA ligase [Myxococcales bacterium]|nr:long-chain fatty acid--CoA ligase [Myxococcales bacterium]